jgi:hypothetical protein
MDAALDFIAMEKVMAAVELERRVAVLEAEVARLKERVEGPSTSPQRWWEKIAEKFADDPAFDEAMRLGREYRESLRPKASERRKG